MSGFILSHMLQTDPEHFCGLPRVSKNSLRHGCNKADATTAFSSAPLRRLPMLQTLRHEFSILTIYCESVRSIPIFGDDA
jgi:hypothetical protein